MIIYINKTGNRKQGYNVYTNFKKMILHNKSKKENDAEANKSKIHFGQICTKNTKIYNCESDSQVVCVGCGVCK